MSLRSELPGCRRPRTTVGTLSGERCGDTGGRTSDESTPKTVGRKNRNGEDEDEDEDAVRYTQLGPVTDGRGSKKVRRRGQRPR